jgi:hypothetical protein
MCIARLARYSLKVQQPATLNVRHTADDHQEPAGGRVQSRIALKYLDRLLRDRTGQSYQQWAGTRRRGKMSWYQIALELAEVTEVESPSPYSLQRWYETPL